MRPLKVTLAFDGCTDGQAWIASTFQTKARVQQISSFGNMLIETDGGAARW